MCGELLRCAWGLAQELVRSLVGFRRNLSPIVAPPSGLAGELIPVIDGVNTPSDPAPVTSFILIQSERSHGETDGELEG